MDALKNAGKLSNAKQEAKNLGQKPGQAAKGGVENAKSGANKNVEDLKNDPSNAASKVKGDFTKNSAKNNLNQHIPGGFNKDEDAAGKGASNVGNQAQSHVPGKGDASDLAGQAGRGRESQGIEGLGSGAHAATSPGAGAGAGAGAAAGHGSGAGAGPPSGGYGSPQRSATHHEPSRGYSSGVHREHSTKSSYGGYEGSRPVSSSGDDQQYTNVKITATQNNIDALTGAPVRIVTTTNARIQPDDKSLHELLEQRQRALREAREAEEELRRARHFNNRSSSEAAGLEARARQRAEAAELASQRARDAQANIERSAALRERQAREEADHAHAVLREAELKHRLAQRAANRDVARSRLDVALRNQELLQADRERKLSHQRAIIDSAKDDLDRANHDAALAEAENRKIQYEFSALLAELEERNDTTLRTASIREAEARNLEVHMDDTLKDARMRSRNASEQVDRLRNENKAKYADIDTGVNQARNAYAQYEHNIPNRRQQYGAELDDAAEALRAAQARFDAAKRRVDQFEVESRQQLSLLQNRIRDSEEAANQFRLQADKRDKEIQYSVTQAYDAVKAAEKRNEKIAEAARAKELEAKELYATSQSITQELQTKRAHPPSPVRGNYQVEIERAQSRYNTEKSKLGQLDTREPSDISSDVEAARNALREAENNYASVEREYNSVKGTNQSYQPTTYSTEPIGSGSYGRNYEYQKPEETTTPSRGASQAYHYPTNTTGPTTTAKSAGPAYVDAPHPGSGPSGSYGGAGSGTGFATVPGTALGASNVGDSSAGGSGAYGGSGYGSSGLDGVKGTQNKSGSNGFKDDLSDSDSETGGITRNKSGKTGNSGRRGSASSTTSRGGLMSNVKHALGMDK